MKSQRIVKSSAAIGSAVALLLVSALSAPSPALAGGGKISATCKLYASGLEPRASGQAKLTGTVAGGYYWSASVTVSCKGLTPGQWYYLEIEDASGYWSASAGVASPTGGLVLGGDYMAVPRPSGCGVRVYSAAGVVLGGFL